MAVLYIVFTDSLVQMRQLQYRDSLFSLPLVRSCLVIFPSQLARIASTSPPSNGINTPNIQEVGTGVYKLHPVDREYDLERLLNISRENIANAIHTEYKPTVPFSSQMFGAGKSTLGENALKLLKEDLARSSDKQRVVPLLLKRGWSLQEIKRYAFACPVLIDLQHDVNQRSSTFRDAMFAALYRAAIGKDKISLAEAEKELYATPFTTTEFIDRLKARTGADLFYIFIDEIRLIEEFAARSSLALFSDLRPPINPVRALLLLVVELLKSGSVFVYIAGRSDLFSQAALKPITSPYSLELMPLGPLSAQDIEKVILRSSSPPGMPSPLSAALVERCKLPDKLVPELFYKLGTNDGRLPVHPCTFLAERIHHWTGGVPRQMQHVLSYALTESLDLSSPAAIEVALSTTILNAIIDKPSVFHSSLLEDSPPAQAAYNTLLALRLHSIPFRSTLKLNDKVLFEWASLLGLHVQRRPDPSNPKNDYEVVMSPYMVEFLRRKSGLRADSRLSATAYLLRQLVVFGAAGSSALDQGGVLEQLLTDVLFLRLAVSSGYTLAHDRLLGRSKLLQEVLLGFEAPDLRTYERSARTSYHPVAVPALYAKGSKPKETEGYEIDEWLAYLSRLPAGVVCRPDQRTSYGPDILFKYQDAHAFFQLKHRRGSELDGPPTFREAICNSLLRFSDQVHQHNSRKRAVLFFVSTQYTNQVEKLMKESGGRSLCLMPGRWMMKAGKLDRIGAPPQIIVTSEEKKNKNGKLRVERVERFEPSPSGSEIAVPAGTELVIVSHEDLNDWLGTRTAADLEKLFTPDPEQPDLLGDALRIFAQSALRSPSSQVAAMPPFALETFLRDEAELDEAAVKEYLPKLQMNKVDEKSLPRLSDAALEKMGVLAWGVRDKILEAAKRRSTDRKQGRI